MPEEALLRRIFAAAVEEVGNLQPNFAGTPWPVTPALWENIFCILDKGNPKLFFIIKRLPK